MKLEMFCLAFLFLPILAREEIAGGPIVSPEKFPFIARLVIQKGRLGSSTCTGTLVKDNLILTARHCFKPDKKLYYFGTATFYDRESKEFTVKMKLVKTYVKNNSSDIALARLTRKVKDITPLGFYTKKLSPGTTVKAAGYGMHGHNQNDEHLRHIDLKVAYDNGYKIGTKIGKNNAGPCEGDSGGPLLVQGGDGWSVAGTLIGGGYSCEDNTVSQAYPDDVYSSVRVIKSGDIRRYR